LFISKTYLLAVSASFLAGCPGLELLSLHGNTRITDAAIDALSEHVKGSLTTLDILGAVQVSRGTPTALLEKLPNLVAFQVHA
jgi:hypothetical protein